MTGDGKSSYQVTSKDVNTLVFFLSQIKAHYIRCGSYHPRMCQLDRGERTLTLNEVDQPVVDAVANKTRGNLKIIQM